MTTLQKQVKRARNRIWLNIWLELAGWMLAGGVVAFAVFAKLVQVAAWNVPLLVVAGALLIFIAVVSVAVSAARRPDERAAAAALDQAAGLRERVSSSLYFGPSGDPFVAALQHDAEQRVGSLTVRQHLRPRMPRSATTAGLSLFVALVLWLVPADWLRSAEARQQQVREIQTTHTRTAVQKQLQDVKKAVQTNPALADLKSELDKLDAMPANKMDRPQDLRREGLKKIDNLADAVRQKKDGEQYQKVGEMKKMLRALKDPEGEATPVQTLTRQLASGDFKSAQETIQQLKEQLATLKHESDKDMVEKLQKQLENLANQLKDVSSQEQLAKKLEQSGVKKEDIERMLQQLTKEDLDQLRKQLEKSGMSQQQIEQLAKQMQKQQGAKQACQNMSKAMQNAAQSAGDGQTGDAMSSLESASDQLSEMEMLEQEMNQLDSAMADLQDMKEQLGDCKSCNGSGHQNGKSCSGCNGTGMSGGQGQGGSGGGQGQLGQGRGGLAQQQQTDVDFKLERQRVATNKGKIIGQFLVDGEQVKGEVSEEIVEVIAAAERDATDTIKRDRVPRQYQKAVREYFRRLPADVGLPPAPDDAAEDTEGESADGAEEETADSGADDE